MKKVIIIDSGFSEIFIKKNESRIIEYIDFSNSSLKYDTTGHGTAVGSIMCSINKDIMLVMYKIYDNTLIQDEQIFVEVLEYILKKGTSDAIIHMSLGVNYYNNTIYDFVKEITQKGNVVVSAYDNSGCISYPAAFDFVIGVESSDLCTKSSDFYLPENEMIDVFSKGGIHKVSDLHIKYALKTGNSLSAAYVSGYLSTFTGILSKAAVLEYLKNISTYEDTVVLDRALSKRVYGVFDNLSRIKKAALFPYNKEIKNIIRFSSLLPFDIKEIYTHKYLGDVGKKVQGVDKQHEIKNISDIDYLSIDTLVIGHLNIIEMFSKKNIKEEIINNCLKNKINLFMLDDKYLDKYYDDFSQQGNFIYAPTIKNNIVGKNSKMHKLKSPVVSIFGTSSKQGKFTLQLYLRELFLSSGYNVAQVSTEPIGELFGMDATIPFGYDSNNNLASKEFIMYINAKMHELDIKEPDLIIIGSQSHTIPSGFDNYGTLAIRQIEYLIAVNPDAALLCINAGDDSDYIQKTVNVIQSMTSSKVLCLVLFPFEYSNNWKGLSESIVRITKEAEQKIISTLTAKTELPVFVLDCKKDIVQIGELIVSFF